MIKYISITLVITLLAVFAYFAFVDIPIDQKQASVTINVTQTNTSKISDQK